MKLKTLSVPVAVLLVPTGAALGQTGVIEGTVEYAGAVPAVEILVTKDQDYCGKTLPSMKTVVREGKLQYGVVYLEAAPGDVPAGKVTLMNRNCAFDPPVFATSVRSIIEAGNEDPILHNTHLRLRRRTVANLALPHQGDKIQNSRALRRPGLVEVECDTHDWMTAKIWVFDHPHFAVTDEAGGFEITGVPPGTYTLKLWHEVLGELEQSVTVRANATTPASFTFPAVAVATGER